MIERNFFNILNFPYIFKQVVMSISMIVSIFILIVLILLIRLIFLKLEQIRMICLLYLLVPLRVLAGIICGYSTTGNMPECTVSVNHLINQCMTYGQEIWKNGADTVRPAIFSLEVLSVPIQIQRIWLIGGGGVLLLLLIAYYIHKKRDIEKKKTMLSDGIRILMISLFWFNPLIWIISIYSKRDEIYVREKYGMPSNIRGNSKLHWLQMGLISVILIAIVFTSFQHINHLNAEQTVRQFYYYLEQEYAGGLKQLYPSGEGNFKEGKRTDEVKKIHQLYEVTNASKYRRYLGHTKKYIERQVIAVNVTRCGYEVSHGVGDKKQTMQNTDIFEVVKRSNEADWEIVYWSEGNWGYWKSF